jgi:hypothetical protein
MVPTPDRSAEPAGNTDAKDDDSLEEECKERDPVLLAAAAFLAAEAREPGMPRE